MKKLKYFLQTKFLGLYINVLAYISPKKASLIAYRLFSEPRDGKLLKETMPEFLRASETEILQHENDFFQVYIWKGNDNVILLVHGWESNTSRWEKILPYLRESGSTIVAIDAPGHGLSGSKEFSIPRYAEYIDAVAKKYDANAIVGHSLGGAASVYYQYKYQNSKLQKMVLLGAPSDLHILVGNYAKLLSLSSRMVSLLDSHFLDKFKFKPIDFSGKIFAEKLQLNGIIAHDTNDELVAFAESQKIAGSWKHAEFIETKGLGHSMHDDALYRKVAAFLVH